MKDDTPPLPRFSVIIPARNEAEFLPLLLDSIDRAQEGFGGTIEVVVADNSSTDATPRIARERGCVVTTVEARGAIAAIRNGGAKSARGELLLFVDADSRLHPDTFARAHELFGPNGGGPIVATTHFTFDRQSLGIRVATFVFVTLANVVGMAGGGSCVICRREDFEAMGGYRESIRMAEDVAFIRDMKRLGRQSRPKRRYYHLKGCRTITSARKFDRYGDWHPFTMPWKSLFATLTRRTSWKKIIDDYWYMDRTS